MATLLGLFASSFGGVHAQEPPHITPLPPYIRYVGLSPRQIAAAIERDGRAQQCLRLTEARSVTVDLELRIERSGAVQSVSVTADDRAFGACVQRAIQLTRFPPSSEASIAELRLTFERGGASG